ncbi:PEP-CTERM sorting domain-containing protein [Pseudoduganella lutea]|uniref:PEP-CTERM sorting domain-containing protein n=2 Tax=Pseudoduganella lutea TaxID=321985 RepID=A0A4P6L7P4_9BURK|nr:PEP-CTERM sorting domain-containing protein [Pseudoduganella lutea]
MLLLAALQVTAVAAPDSTVTFGQGAEGWQGLQPMDGNGGTSIDTSLGNGAPALHTQIEHFGATWSTTTNTNFVRDYTQMQGVTFGIDVLANSVWFFNREVTRDLVIELRDYDNQANGLPYTSVWTKVGTLDASKAGWQHLSVTIADTSALGLPAGWGGYGNEDAQGNPYLPSDRTFASVLAGVDEVAFTTFVPGFAFGFTYFDVAVDNISISPVPEPAQGGMLLAGLAAMAALARRRARR